MSRRLALALAAALLATPTAWSGPALAGEPDADGAEEGAEELGEPIPEIEPWSDADPDRAPVRHGVGAPPQACLRPSGPLLASLASSESNSCSRSRTGVTLGAEYRANWLYVNPIALSSVNQRRASFIDQRLRLDTRLDYDEKVAIVLSMDALDGVLWGDNGTFAREPLPNSGLRVSASGPNTVRAVVGFKGGDDPSNADNYGYVLEEADVVFVRRAYGEVTTPVGLLRIGRQPTTQGTGLLVADGDGRRNRFGISNRGDTSDRILFATKPLEGGKPAHLVDRSKDNGLFFVLFYDRIVTNKPEVFGDDLQMVGTSVRLLDKKWSAGEKLNVSATYVHRWAQEFDTTINGTGLRAMSHFGDWHAGAEFAAVLGASREVSEALAKVKSEPVVRQDIRQFGARGVVKYDQPTWGGYLELDFASGDSDPETGSPLTQFTFAEDANVGLLMFEHVLAFESARSARAGVELLRALDAVSFPAERVDTEGSFTNAVAIFPQFDLKPHPNVLFRGGVLVAFTPGGLVDPIESLRLKDGNTIEDDRINFHGGKPGHFYGVELDGRFQWRFLERFRFDLEGALLFPGDALENQHGQAARSALVQGRTTFVF